jgi:hypothetical protein
VRSAGAVRARARVDAAFAARRAALQLRAAARRGALAARPGALQMTDTGWQSRSSGALPTVLSRHALSSSRLLEGVLALREAGDEAECKALRRANSRLTAALTLFAALLLALDCAGLYALSESASLRARGHSREAAAALLACFAGGAACALGALVAGAVQHSLLQNSTADALRDVATYLHAHTPAALSPLGLLAAACWLTLLATWQAVYLLHGAVALVAGAVPSLVAFAAVQYHSLMAEAELQQGAAAAAGPSRV